MLDKISFAIDRMISFLTGHLRFNCFTTSQLQAAQWCGLYNSPLLFYACNAVWKLYILLFFVNTIFCAIISIKISYSNSFKSTAYTILGFCFQAFASDSWIKQQYAFVCKLKYYTMVM